MMIFTTVLTVILAVLAVLFLIYLLVLVRPRARMPKNKNLLCDYAHRGLHGDGIPENSLAAFERACERGYGIELDVQLSRDGVVTVFHDYTLSRMTGHNAKLCELTSDELSALRLAKTEEKIPTFSEALSLIDGRVPLLVELKGESLDTSLCEKVAAELSRYKGEYCVESFNPLLIRGIKKHLPSVYCGLLYTNACRDKKKYSALNIAISAMALNFIAYPDFIAYNHLDRESLPVKITTRLYRAPKFTWTVKSREEVEKAHALGEYPIFEQEEG